MSLRHGPPPISSLSDSATACLRIGRVSTPVIDADTPFVPTMRAKSTRGTSIPDHQARTLAIDISRLADVSGASDGKKVVRVPVFPLQTLSAACSRNYQPLIHLTIVQATSWRHILMLLVSLMGGLSPSCVFSVTGAKPGPIFQPPGQPHRPEPERADELPVVREATGAGRPAWGALFPYEPASDGAGISFPCPPSLDAHSACYRPPTLPFESLT